MNLPMSLLHSRKKVMLSSTLFISFYPVKVHCTANPHFRDEEIQFTGLARKWKLFSCVAPAKLKLQAFCFPSCLKMFLGKQIPFNFYLKGFLRAYLNSLALTHLPFPVSFLSVPLILWQKHIKPLRQQTEPYSVSTFIKLPKHYE